MRTILVCSVLFEVSQLQELVLGAGEWKIMADKHVT
jgi:hypothetical protein